MKHPRHYILGTLLLVFPSFATSAEIETGEMAGYLLVPHEKVPESYNAGFAVYAAVWPKHRDYLVPPTTGSLADLDPALLVMPPKGFEAGYVPMVTRQELANSWKK